MANWVNTLMQIDAVHPSRRRLLPNPSLTIFCGIIQGGAPQVINYISIPRSGEFYEFSYPALAPLCWFAGSQIVLNSWNISPCQVESEIHPT